MTLRNPVRNLSLGRSRGQPWQVPPSHSVVCCALPPRCACVLMPRLQCKKMVGYKYCLNGAREHRSMLIAGHTGACRLLPLRYQKRPQASAPGGKQKAGVLELRIGYHLLEGGVEKLKKPLAVLEKRAIPRDEDMDDGAGPSACSGSAAPGEWLYDAEGLPRVPQPGVEYKAWPIFQRSVQR